MYRLGLKLWSINTDQYYDEAVRLYEEGVYDYIELYIVPDSLRALPAWMELEIPYIIHAPHFAHGLNLAKKECEGRNAVLYSEVREFADALMTDIIIFHGGIEGDIEETARQLASFEEARAVIENKPYKALPSMGGERCRGFSPEELKVVIDTAECGFCFDIGHALCSAASQGFDSYGYLEEFMTLNPAIYHLTDVADLASEYDKHLHLGTGVLDFKRVLSLISIDAVITIETDKDCKINLNDFVKDMEFIANYESTDNIR